MNLPEIHATLLYSHQPNAGQAFFQAVVLVGYESSLVARSLARDRGDSSLSTQVP